MSPVQSSFLLLTLVALLSFINNVLPIPHTDPHELAPRATNITNDITATCFDPRSQPGAGFANLTDCNAVLAQIVREPDFIYKHGFSRNPRRGAIEVPKEWQQGDCTIFLTCGNDYDLDWFSYANVAHTARRIIKQCLVDQPDKPYGGFEVIGTLGTFFVVVGKPRVTPPGAMRNASHTAS